MLLRFPASKMPPREVQSKNKITSLLPQLKSDSKVDTLLQPLPQHVTKKKNCFKLISTLKIGIINWRWFIIKLLKQSGRPYLSTLKAKTAHSMSLQQSKESMFKISCMIKCSAHLF